MDGVIVAVTHDEFWGMGLRGFAGIMDEGVVVVDVRGWCAATAAPSVMSNK